MTYTYKIIQYKNEHHGSVALTDAQHEIKLVKTYNETLKTILRYIQSFTKKQSFIYAD